jgi:hypothetical protein
MRNLYFTLSILALIFTVSCNDSAKTSEELSGNDADSSIAYYGEKITEDGAINSEEFINAFNGKDSIQTKLSAVINEVCQKKGCWMTVDLGNNREMTVRFKDYGFFVPKNASGMKAVMQGWAYVDTISVEDLKHYTEDKNAPKEEIEAITEPKIEWTFMASGVIIKK